MQENMQEVNIFAEQAIDLAVNNVPQLAMAVAVLLIGLWIIKAVCAGQRKALTRREVKASRQRVIENFTNIGLKVMLFIGIASMVGIETTSLLAILGAAGLAIGLAIQGSLGNFAGGVIIMLFRPFRVGDFIEACGQAGVVQEIGVFNSVITTGDNKTVIMPNGAVSNGVITNYSTQETRRVDIVFGVELFLPKKDLKNAKDILAGLMEADERILKDPAPTVVVSALGDSAVDITTRSWVASSDYWDVYHDLMENAKLALEDAGITIPNPQVDVPLNKAA